MPWRRCYWRPKPEWATPAAKLTGTLAISPCFGPASIQKLCALNRSGHEHDFFHDYCQHGKRAYYIASTIEVPPPDEEAEVLERLSHEFDLCAYGLGEVRREWERREPEGGGGPIVIE